MTTLSDIRQIATRLHSHVLEWCDRATSWESLRMYVSTMTPEFR